MDLRVPTGWLFLILGAILVVMGTLVSTAPAPLSPVNINLYAGIAMVVFGGAMLWLAKQNT